MVARKANAKDEVLKLTALVSLEERKLVRQAAFLSEQSVAQFIRAAAVKAAQRVAKQTLVALDKAA